MEQPGCWPDKPGWTMQDMGRRDADNNTSYISRHFRVADFISANVTQTHRSLPIRNVNIIANVGEETRVWLIFLAQN
ncbi:uncharacterized protein LOC116842254 isoform X2 [Odontomachus brunneus]|uniref:uncharacterized protein LOC116842254 isoform X2 n=1 Tax=Odontomachus brunneus TaxID=486640 RepID=UPI0013F203EC|nr:uncharacterized protein LOC116842254 isoform X2 [Odontomachus brunneus]